MTDQERVALYQMAYKEASLGPGARYAIGGTAGAALGVILATTTARDRKEAIRNSLMFGGLLGVIGGSVGLKTAPSVRPTSKEPQSEKFSRTGPIHPSELVSGKQEPIKPEEWKKSKDDSPTGIRM